MSINTLYNDLTINLYRPFIFYVLDSIIPEEKKETFNFSENLNKIFNKVLVLDNNLEILYLSSEPNNLNHLLNKISVLDENMFLLLEKKETLKEFQFDFLLKKYVVNLNYYVYISKWMENNKNSELLDIDDSIKNFFTLQYNAILNHKKAVQSSFNLDDTLAPQPKEIVRHIEETILPINKLLIPREETEPNKKNVVVKKKKQKKVIITDEEAEKFLLKSVFNIV